MTQTVNYTDITKQYTDDDPMPYEVNILRSEILSIDMNEIFVERDPSFNLITGSFKVRDNGYTFKSLDESVAIVSNDGVVYTGRSNKCNSSWNNIYCCKG